MNIDNAGWTLISIPVEMNEKQSNTIFPSAISPDFTYEGAYHKVDSNYPCFGTGKVRNC